MINNVTRDEVCNNTTQCSNVLYWSDQRKKQLMDSQLMAFAMENIDNNFIAGILKGFA